MRPTRSGASCAAPSGAPCRPAARSGATSFVGTKIFSDRQATSRRHVGRNLHEVVDRRFGRSIVWGIIGEDLPEESNRVVLDPLLTDTDGIPAPKLVYHNSADTRRHTEVPCRRAASRRCRRPAPSRRRSCIRCATPAGICSAPARWATIRRPRSSIVGPDARRAQSLHFRRQHLPDVGRPQSDRDDHVGGAAPDDALIAERRNQEAA